MAKGSSYERELCKLLSEWWCPGRSDIFWRTSSSGARTTQRRKQGKTTAFQGSDITATDPSGFPLIDLFAIEAKRGYSKATMQDSIDRTSGQKLSQLEQWIQQASKASEDAGSFAWLLIQRRNRRDHLVYLPQHASAAVKQLGGLKSCVPRALICLPGTKLYCTTLAEWFRTVTPDMIRAMADKY